MLARIKQWVGGRPNAPTAAPPAPAPAPTYPSTAPLRVLMVCMGNICRSPTAEGVLRAKLQRAGLAGVSVDSAGTHGYHTSEPPFKVAVERAKLRGYDLSGLRARPVKTADFGQFDLMLAMDESNLKWLHKRLPQGEAGRASLLMGYATRHPGVLEVPDPYYGGPDGFDRVLDLVEDACDGVVAALVHHRAQPRHGAARG
jgi:protein-tyrosine phosphatase